MSQRPLQIGQLAQAAGVGTDTIRYYERRGLLPTPNRLASGYRVYAADAIERLRFIRHAQALGFTLTEIQQLLQLNTEADTCEAVATYVAHKLTDIDQKLAALNAIRDALTQLATRCHQPATSSCPFLEALERPETTDD